MFEGMIVDSIARVTDNVSKNRDDDLETAKRINEDIRKEHSKRPSRILERGDLILVNFRV